MNHNVKVNELDVIDTNQIFARDLGLTDGNFFLSSILPDRELELNGLKHF